MESREVRIERVRVMMRGVVMSMVGDMDAVSVVPGHVRGRLTLELRVAAADVCHVVGKKGKTARSLRQILSVASGRNGLVCDLSIVQDKRAELAARA